MDGAEEQVLQRRLDAGGGLPRDFVLFRDEIFLTAAFRATFAIRTFPFERQRETLE